MLSAFMATFVPFSCSSVVAAVKASAWQRKCWCQRERQHTCVLQPYLQPCRLQNCFNDSLNTAYTPGVRSSFWMAGVAASLLSRALARGPVRSPSKSS